MRQNFLILMSLLLVFLFLYDAYSQTRTPRTQRQETSQSATNVVTNAITNTVNNVDKVSSSQPTQVQAEKSTGVVQNLPIEVEIKTSSTPEAPEGIEYIKTYAKEKGIKIYAEFGGGPMVTGGIVWRITPIFGVGIGGGYTPLPYRNFGPVLDLKAEFVPMHFFIVENELKMNVLSGLRGVFFFGSMTQYMGANVGVEFLLRVFQYMVPSFNVYLYLAGKEIIPQLSFQTRVQF